MLQWIIDLFQSLFRRPTPSATFMRSRIEAANLRQQSQDLVSALVFGNISCPWHQERGRSCRFDKATGVVQCPGCHRTTDMEGLLRRLRDYDVYERAVE